MELNRQPQSEPRRRTVITGIGVIAPNGLTLEKFWTSIRDGRSAAGPVKRFDASELPNRIAAEVSDFDPTQFMASKRMRRCDRSTHYGVASSKLALQDASLTIDGIDPDRIGVIEGTTVSGMESMFRGQRLYMDKGVGGLNPFTVINAYCGEGSSRIAYELGVKGHSVTYCSGCASGNDAIGYGQQLIELDEADVVLAGAVDDTMAEPMFAGFCALKLMTSRNENPAEAMRPFDRLRDGFLLGEGAAFLVLEELSHALARRASIYGEVLGHGRSCEAYHPTDTHPEGVGMRRAMQKAFRRAGLHPSEVDYINAHGTATLGNDPIETYAIKMVFGDAAKRVAVSSTKPVTGHLMGAAGAVETAVCALALRHQVIPPTINLADPDPRCDLDFVPNRPRPYPIRAALNLSAGFGGKNACLILGAWPEP